MKHLCVKISLVIPAASVFEILCRKSDTQKKTLTPSTAVGVNNSKIVQFP